jgi:hypothetical protein
VPQLQHQSGEEEEQREGLGKERGENDEPGGGGRKLLVVLTKTPPRTCRVRLT